ncbi:MAG TPA: DUF1707 domain-containing protein [Streptosporangiaceae bacterium]
MSSRQAPRDLRASDADRERVVTMLAEAVGDGRLTLEEHAQRLEQASSARTLGDLAGLTTDLVGPDAQPLHLDGARPMAAVFTNQRREGRWVVPERMAVTAIFGEAVLDFRSALLQSARVTVYVTVICGRLKLLVPEGVRVEISGTAVATRKRGVLEQRPAPGGGYEPGPSDTPVIEVRGVIMGGKVQAITPRGRFRGRFSRRDR